MHDYWIGDRVWVASERMEGVFEGEQGEMALVKIQGVRKPFPFAEISLLPEEDDSFIELHPEAKDQKRTVPFTFWDRTIDLHIEELNPALLNAEPAQILAHQVSRLKTFIEKAIDSHAREVHVIYGRGEGVLRSEVLKYLESLTEMRSVQEEGHGGAVRVCFN